MLFRLFIAPACLFATASSASAEMRPHEAVYEMSLAEQSSDFNDIDGRIALQLKRDGCDAFALDYRFVARFHENDEMTVTDQQTVSKETRDGARFEFRTKTLVDGAEQATVEGQAVNGPSATQVTYRAPVSRELSLPLSHFPIGHTAQLIERALKGERIVETKLFDGDDEADKELTTTAIIAPARPGDDASQSAEVKSQVAGLRSWQIVESYFNSDSDGDGLPIFETRYRLYENGVSDELYLNFGAYALRGTLGRLVYLDTGTACPN